MSDVAAKSLFLIVFAVFVAYFLYVWILGLMAIISFFQNTSGLTKQQRQQVTGYMFAPSSSLNDTWLSAEEKAALPHLLPIRAVMKKAFWLVPGFVVLVATSFLLQPYIVRQ